MAEHPVRRRADLHPDCHDSPCDELNHLTEDILQRLDKMNAKLDAMSEVLVAWNNAKGFISTMRIIGLVAKWLTITGASFAAIWYWLHGGSK